MTDILSSNELTLPSPQKMPANEVDNRSEGDIITHDIFESSEDSGSERIAVKKKNNRTNHFSDSESDVDKENSVENIKSLPDNNASSDSDDYTSILKQRSKKSRIKNVKSDSDSDSEQSQLRENLQYIARESPHSTRITEKRNNLRKKLQDLHSKNKTDDEIPDKNKTIVSEINSFSGPGSSNDEEIASINEIKKKVKEHRNNLKMSVCDPDTSEDDSSHPRHAEKPKKQQRRTKLISPKHQRMSAKQAMENMQKIKSESNRMLREKEVSLPYHRPKALSLKDIMSRRKPAVSSDGKVLPIKMNDEQLRQYALQLEQRQKEMMELCKSDSEEDEEEPNETAENTEQTGKMSVESTESATEINKESETASEVPENVHDSSSNNVTNTENTIDLIIDTNTDIQESVRSAETHCNDSESLLPNDTVISNINTDITNVEDNSENVSAGMELVYKDSVEGETLADDKCLESNEITENNAQEDNEAVDCGYVEKRLISTDAETDESVFKSVDNYNASENFTEKDSQLISLRYDTEKTDSETNETLNNNTSSEKPMEVDDIDNNEFPDSDDNDLDDINMEDIDKIIENAEIIRADMTDKKFNSPALVKDTVSLTSKPKLMGAPGMVIDLDGNDAALPKKLTGVELLKERFTYFAKLKTPEEMERDKEKRQKPGAQHLRLKHELEEKIADQRSLEWAKRLEGEKEHQKELEAIRGDTSDVEDDIDTIEAKLEEKESEIKASSSSEEEEEEIEDDVLIEDKPRKKNPLVEDEAEESDDEAENDGNDDKAEFGEESTAGSNKVNDESDEDSSNDDESSESEEEQETKPKKGRILKAFEDSDDDETTPNKDKVDDQPLESNSQHATDSISSQIEKDENKETDKISDVTVLVDVNKVNEKEITKLCKSDSISESQDDDLQLAQVPKANSEDLFTSQESVVNKPTDVKTTNAISDNNDVDLGSQTFSIMTSNSVLTKGLEMEIGSQEKISVISETQTFDDNLDAVVGMCSGTFSQNYIEFKPSTQSQNVESQAIGEDILDMCTGKFYDNEFVSQPDDNVTNTSTEITQQCTLDTENVKKVEDEIEKTNKKNDEIDKRDKDILKSVLDELNEPEFESTKPMKFFFDTKSQNKENEHSENNTQLKKRFVIDSDDDTNENAIISDKKKKKLKKKRQEKRALQISDDEDDEYSDQDCEELMSENGDVQNNEEDRLVEYDSEENEIEVKPQQKKKRKVADFFEQEAELSSEDEWAGSGDEDEAGLDRMEREEGDDEVFHQGKLQAELGQIHMRDVLDQDKREVRLIQELLFEDGDLGSGGRQRKFRWRNADGEEVDGPLPDELADTQEEEFESEEQWRKQRHEREMFLRQLKSQGEEKEDLNVSITRSTIIKANLLSRTMSSVLEEVSNKTVVETTQLPTVPEKKITKDIPSPNKPFSVFQQNYHGSLLTRGRGALARLAALATPLAVDDDAPKVGLIAATCKRNFVFAAIAPEDKQPKIFKLPRLSVDDDAPKAGLVAATSKRNFVFAAIAPEDKQPKVTKRKAEAAVGTPRLVKKMRTEDKKQPKSSLLDHFKT